MIILIPAYEPDHKLVDLVSSIRVAAPEIGLVLVDDGSGPGYAQVFGAAEDLGCTVVRHGHNRGKGIALKTGFAHIAQHHPGQEVVCADCDGQHRLDDILRVAKQVVSAPDTMVLGVRSFTGQVPARSRLGNSVTRVLFLFATGRNLTDTQTGLRGYPAAMLPWLQQVSGSRFEYELNLLLEAGPAGYRIDELPIETIYLASNASSHFRPVVDSVRVYVPLLKFFMSSLSAFVVDAAFLFLLMYLTHHLLFSVVTARVISATFNYLMNRHLVFGRGRTTSLIRSSLRYGSLVVTLLLANYALMHVLVKDLRVNLVVAKVLTEVTLFGISYHLQRLYVFASPITARYIRRRTHTLLSSNR